MIQPTCNRCGNELTAIGALAFSPPTPQAQGTESVTKVHICVYCYEEFLTWTKTKLMVVHHLYEGLTACSMTWPPSSWPAGHFWTTDWKDVTCAQCLKRKP